MLNSSFNRAMSLPAGLRTSIQQPEQIEFISTNFSFALCILSVIIYALLYLLLFLPTLLAPHAHKPYLLIAVSHEYFGCVFC